MTSYENSSNFFLLQTENFEPLLKLIDQLSLKVEENQEIIERITKKIDGEFDFPEYKPIKLEEDGIEKNGTTTTKKNKAASPDILRLFLNDKYKLDQIKIDETGGNQKGENDTIRGLRNDIARLRKLRDSNSKKNKDLYQIILDYEMFVVKDILPRIREDIARYQQESTQDIREQQMVAKFTSESKLWEDYNSYVEHLDRLVLACHRLTEMTDVVNSREMSILEQKLAILNEIRLNFPGKWMLEGYRSK
ncbi:hypothetical protein CAAN1_20S00760 [[Candida] anglica]|uniref:Uncharacterized protein n=1 Tax=[Candida] anglica TaxID=148631 RepID=A0ABP0EFT4_9ASCO